MIYGLSVHCPSTRFLPPRTRSSSSPESRACSQTDAILTSRYASNRQESAAPRSKPAFPRSLLILPSSERWLRGGPPDIRRSRRCSRSGWSKMRPGWSTVGLARPAWLYSPRGNCPREDVAVRGVMVRASAPGVPGGHTAHRALFVCDHRHSSLRAGPHPAEQTSRALPAVADRASFSPASAQRAVDHHALPDLDGRLSGGRG